jgi:hypothetical protein
VPVEAKPIFRPDVLRLPLMGFKVPEQVTQKREKLTKWAAIISTGSIDAHKEQEILGDFINDIFCELLGYTRAVDNPKRYTISREKHVQADGKIADAVLGVFVPEGKRYIAALEGKGPKDPLDRPFAGRKVSAVDQAFDYAINLRCNWIIVTNIRQTRLYYKGTDKQTFERFDTEALANDDKQLCKFMFLLHANRMAPLHGPPHLDTLLQESEKIGRDLTNEFYAQYAFARRSTLSRLRWLNPDVEPRLILACSQKLLDRILFVAFCEDRGLLPPETIKRAVSYRDPYNPRPLWDNFRGMFRSVNVGNADLNIHKYNGGLFADDPVLDTLKIPDEVFGLFRDLAEYDFRPASVVAEAETVSNSRLIDVEILGHIFEQSINDLEKLQAELDKPVEALEAADAEKSKPKVSKRKREGAFYTPAYITRYIVEQALGGVLRDRFENLRAAKEQKAKAAARSTLADPRAYDLESLKPAQRDALLGFWLDWQHELGTIRILDPACGSGAFLIEAFDQLHTEYERANERVRELRGFAELFDLDRKILQDNLYGVDLNEEAVHIAKLSLWIKTAAAGKELTSLDRTLRVGNSIVADSQLDPRAFDWNGEFPEVLGSENGSAGFDVVIGNPPYIRQEWLSSIKSYLQSRYAAYHGMADIYVYFYELGLSLLRPGGRLSYVVTNKWMKAGYGEPLRELLAQKSWVESVIDFGHAKQIFEDADVFPSIVVIRRPQDQVLPPKVRVCSIPREQLRIDDLSVQIAKEGVEVGRERLSPRGWSLESEEANDLREKVRSRGTPLSEYLGAKPLMGIKTGLNEAFLIDTPTRDRIVALDPGSADIIRPYLRGQDIGRWSPDWAGLWMIALKSSGDHEWPWAGAGQDAESIFSRTYPGIHRHLKPLEGALRKRQDQGRFWWELRACAYWKELSKPRIAYQDITWSPSFCLTSPDYLSNNTTYFLSSDDEWLLCVLNAPIGWWFAWRTAQHGKDEALRYFTSFVESYPVPRPTKAQAVEAGGTVRRLVETVRERRRVAGDVLDWLKAEHGIDEPSLRLRSALELDSESFVAEVRRLRGKKSPLSLVGLRSLRDEHKATIVPAQTRAKETLALERRVSDLVSDAYGLTADEVGLMWQTAPPRMPVPGPATT